MYKCLLVRQASVWPMARLRKKITRNARIVSSKFVHQLRPARARYRVIAHAHTLISRPGFTSMATGLHITLKFDVDCFLHIPKLYSEFRQNLKSVDFILH